MALAHIHACNLVPPKKSVDTGGLADARVYPK